jgi:predicted CXXCH cytochrome family protein
MANYCRIIVCLAAIAGVLSASMLAYAPPPVQPTKQASNAYVGSDACQSCHDDQYRDIADSPHKKLFDATDPSYQGCEACHGPGSKHVDGNGDPDKIFRYHNASVTAVREQCNRCHEQHTQVGHLRLACTTCHNIHKPESQQFLLTKPENQLCQTCHK